MLEAPCNIYSTEAISYSYHAFVCFVVQAQPPASSGVARAQAASPAFNAFANFGSTQQVKELFGKTRFDFSSMRLFERVYGHIAVALIARRRG